MTTNTTNITNDDTTPTQDSGPLLPPPDEQPQQPPMPPENDPKENTTPYHEQPPTTHLPKSRIYLMVTGEAGLIFSWVLRFALTTPYFQHTLNSGTILSHSVWILGPLSGILVAPLVGILSDRCTSSYGRRRPFIFWGLITSLISMNVFASTIPITRFLGLHYKWAEILLAVVSYAVMDLSANVIMFPSRALMGDLVPREQQHDVQSCAAVVASATEIVASLFLYAVREPVSRIRDVYAVASFVMVVTVFVTLVVCEEKVKGVDDGGEVGMVEMERLDEGDVADGKGGLSDMEEDGRGEEVGDGGERDGGDEGVAFGVSEQGLVGSVYELMRTAVMSFPRELNKVGVVYGLAWFCWYASLPYFSAWIGSEVVGGDPNAIKGTAEAKAYQTGVNVFAIANGFKAVLALAFGATYPNMLKVIGAVGERVIFAGTFAIFCPVLYLASSTKSVFLAGFTVALSGVAFIATQTIPIAIVVQRFSQNVALNLGILNLYCVIPQLLDTLYTGFLAKRAGEATVLKIAAGWGFAAAIAAYFLL